ncbi:14 kDa zinc-binding protein [Capsicum annuum]|uniref:adenylylsulfatase HINT1-like n=1 Tax=Capsicum annuum TaxID=4072 RepID=UPI001FB0523A|nr:adenylylsulfatase HINT1-like [Capsicum annuum]KAF3633290.1 14 kDa zinc-binding protein [Capsicum annuum]KAF3645067.1 14 kDa zinc-binding protein [Capsicum annuum]
MASEKEATLLVVPSDAPSIFDKIIKKEIPADIVHEDDKARNGLTRLSKAEEKHRDILGQLLYTIKLVAKQEGLLENGFRLVINDGRRSIKDNVI